MREAALPRVCLRPGRDAAVGEVRESVRVYARDVSREPRRAVVMVTCLCDHCVKGEQGHRDQMGLGGMVMTCLVAMSASLA